MVLFGKVALLVKFSYAFIPGPFIVVWHNANSMVRIDFRYTADCAHRSALGTNKSRTQSPGMLQEDCLFLVLDKKIWVGFEKINFSIFECTSNHSFE